MTTHANDFAVGAICILPNDQGTRSERYSMAVNKLAHMIAGEIRSRVHAAMETSPHKGLMPQGESTEYRTDLIVFTPEELREFVDEKCKAYDSKTVVQIAFIRNILE